MSNAYGFDFLKNQHKLSESDDPLPVAHSQPTISTSHFDEIDFDKVANKPDLEKQADILRFLKAHRSAGYLPPSIIYKGTGVDLEDSDQSVAKILENNLKIALEQVPDPENPSVTLTQYSYQSKYNHVRDRDSLLGQINRSKYGVDQKDLLDCYDGVEDDVAALITAGDIAAISNSEDKTTIFFPRAGTFLVELDGTIQIGPKSNNEVVVIETDIDPRKQIRRGEAVCVGGQWFRVSSAVRAGVPLTEQPARAQAPLTVTSLTDLPKRNEVDGYIRPLSEKLLPLDGPLATGAKENLIKSQMARQKLHKLVGGRGLSSGPASQLLSSLAHSSNPTTLAASLMTPQGSRSKRPTSHSKNNPQSLEQARKDAKEAHQVASDPSLALYAHSRRHGCTKDVRDMYLATRNRIPTDEEELYNSLVQHKLLEKGEAWRPPKLKKKANVDNDGKPKKRRYYERKNQRMTNTHLVGTVVGALLADAAEKQKQGKSVGDGGM